VAEARTTVRVTPPHDGSQPNHSILTTETGLAFSGFVTRRPETRTKRPVKVLSGQIDAKTA
jgi:hypothetical protein